MNRPKPFPIRDNGDGTFSVKISCQCGDRAPQHHCPVCNHCLLWVRDSEGDGVVESASTHLLTCPSCKTRVRIFIDARPVGAEVVDAKETKA